MNQNTVFIDRNTFESTVLSDITNSKGIIFSVVFVKRTDNSFRKMVCRTGVKKHLRGGVAPYNFSEMKLLSVFDLQKKDYRSVDLNSIVEVTIRGTHYKIV